LSTSVAAILVIYDRPTGGVYVAAVNEASGL
jgi:hypothetical protein